MAGAEDLADDLLARALHGPTPWLAGAQPEQVVERAIYHGVTGYLVRHAEAWPAEVMTPLRHAALPQAMWEMRHRHVLAGLLAAFHAAGVRALVLKGSALAYDLYDEPSERSRGDSDVLIPPEDLDAARRVLSACGFSHFLDDPSSIEAVRFQERWERRTPDGLDHDIDLHWQLLDAASLTHVLPFDAAWARARPLPRLSPEARGLAREHALLFACAHRAQHVLHPYFVGDTTHFGGDRLVWLRDVDLLARALPADGWAAFEAAALEGGLAAVALDGLGAAARRLGTPLPQGTLARLAAAPQDTPASRYLLAGHQAERALRDLRAVKGLGRKAAYAWERLLPPPAFMRLKYPDLVDRPLALLYFRRIVEFLTPASRKARR